MGSYDLVDVGELDPEGPGGMVRKVRRALDAIFSFLQVHAPAALPNAECSQKSKSFCVPE